VAAFSSPCTSPWWPALGQPRTGAGTHPLVMS
jgi:hypothetical protein